MKRKMKVYFRNNMHDRIKVNLLIIISRLFTIAVGEESIKVAAQLLRSAAMRDNDQAKYSYAQLLRTGILYIMFGVTF